MIPFLAQLAQLDEHLSHDLHALTRRRVAVREALLRLRTGEAPALVAARLAHACPEVVQEMTQ